MKGRNTHIRSERERNDNLLSTIYASISGTGNARGLFPVGCRYPSIGDLGGVFCHLPMCVNRKPEWNWSCQAWDQHSDMGVGIANGCLTMSAP